MSRRKDIDEILMQWPYQPGEVMARLVKASDGREVLQMRVDMGVLQMEVDRRPDGFRPHGSETYFDYLISQESKKGTNHYVAGAMRCGRSEFVQYYHRRICWLALREFRRAMKDADHTLAFMDFIKKHSPEEDWTVSHEQYRPFVLFHRRKRPHWPSWKIMVRKRRSTKSSLRWNSSARCSKSTKFPRNTTKMSSSVA